MDPAKLKVTELRSELQAKGLDTKGIKSVLVDRLKLALESEMQGGDSGDAELVKEVISDVEATEDAEHIANADKSPEKITSEKEESDSHADILPVNGSQSNSVPNEDLHVKPDPDEYCTKKDFEEAPVVMDSIKQEYDVKQEQVKVKEEHDHKRKLDDASDQGAKRLRPEIEEVRIENEPPFDKTKVVLDWYNSDLSLMVNPETRASAEPLCDQGFAYVWHGARATYGFTQGRIFYEVRIDSHCEVPHLEAEEQHPYVIRVGWSVDSAGLVLGEEPFSWGYGGTGKASYNLKFKDYGMQFSKGDIVGCYLDMDVDPIVMSFTVNGKHQGMAYEISHKEIGDQALFPHILTKNSVFSVNFGEEENWSESLPDYTFCANVPVDERVLGGQGPEKAEECEIIMMVGLPACGKTTWVEKYIKEHADKKYYVLGTNFLLDKMRVNGLSRKRNYAGRWDALISKCTKCLNKLLELASKRRRNVIIDQTNVYASAQRRKMKGFKAYQRRAVIICPSDEDLKIRSEKQEKVEGKDVPENAVLEMKANFKLPEVGDVFDKVEYFELQRYDAEKLIKTYNKDGRDAGFAPKDGFRSSFSRGGGSGGRGGGYRGDHRPPFRRGGGNDRGDRGGRFNRGGFGGYRGSGSDHRERRGISGGWNRDRGGSYDRSSSSYRRGGGGSGGNGGYNQRDRYSSWKGQSSRGRGGGGGSSWGGSQDRGQNYSSWNSQNYGGSTHQGGYGGAGGGGGGYNWNQMYYGQQPQSNTWGQQSYGSYSQGGSGGSTGSGWNQSGGQWGSGGSNLGSWSGSQNASTWGSAATTGSGGNWGSSQQGQYWGGQSGYGGRGGGYHK